MGTDTHGVGHPRTPLLGVVRTVTGLVHELQKEGGTTALYLASGGGRFVDELVAQRAQTDAAFLGLMDAAADLRSDLESIIPHERAQVLRLLEDLPTVRTDVDRLGRTPADAVTFYIDLKEALLLGIGSITLGVASQAERSGLVALLALTRAKELAAIERAMLAEVFTRDRFVPGQLVRLTALIAGQESLLRIFDQSTDADRRHDYTLLQAHPAVVRAQAFETDAIGNGVSGFGVDAGEWFTAMTQRIDLLRSLELAQLDAVSVVDVDADDDPDLDEALHAAVTAMRELRGLADAVQRGEESIREMVRGRADALGSAARQLAAARSAAARMASLAVTDPLTRLANRGVTPQLVRDALGRVDASTGAAVVTLDLDHFKQVNDTLGHAAGDRLLRAVAERLRSAIRATDTAARVGGDEFIVVLEPVLGIGEATGLAHRLLDEVRRPIDIDGRSLRASMSVGVAIGVAGDSAEDLLRRSDVAAYEAKRLGRDRVVAHDGALARETSRRREREQQLRLAVDVGALGVRRTPIRDLDGCVSLHDVAPDWIHAEDPAVADLAGLRSQITVATTRAAITDWADTDGRSGVLVQLDAGTLSLPSSVDLLVDCAERHRLEPGAFWIAVTEAAASSSRVARDQVDRLAALGCPIVLDEFGTRGTSMTALRDLPATHLRIDVAAQARDQLGVALVRSVSALAQATGIGVIAMGTDGVMSLDELRSLGIGLAEYRPETAETDLVAPQPNART